MCVDSISCGSKYSWSPAYAVMRIGVTVSLMSCMFVFLNSVSASSGMGMENDLLSCELPHSKVPPLDIEGDVAYAYVTLTYLPWYLSWRLALIVSPGEYSVCLRLTDPMTGISGSLSSSSQLVSIAAGIKVRAAIKSVCLFMFLLIV